MTRTKLFGVMAAAAAMLFVATAYAQMYLDGAAKARGDYSGRSFGNATSGARSYTNNYREYARTTPTIDPEVARDAADAIGDYITKSQKHMTWMRKEAEKAKDKDTLASLDVIDKNLADASKAHHEMHDLCMKDTVDKSGSMKCCEQIDASLATAIGEHDKLMKKLGMPMPTATKK